MEAPAEVTSMEVFMNIPSVGAFVGVTPMEAFVKVSSV